MALMTQKSEFKQIAAGTYYAVIQSIGPKTIPDGKGGEASGAEWKFALGSQGPHYGDVAEAFTSLAWSPRSKCYQWATSLLGYAPDPEEPIDIEQFIGYECYVIVAQDPNKPERTKVTSLQRVIREAPPLPAPPRPAQTPSPATAAAPAAAGSKGKAKSAAAAPVAPPLPAAPPEDADDLDF
ncbi:hypothetical protein J7643_03605 [bacterium]|nr:hypothetical protein [bacterium]